MPSQFQPVAVCRVYWHDQIFILFSLLNHFTVSIKSNVRYETCNAQPGTVKQTMRRKACTSYWQKTKRTIFRPSDRGGMTHTRETAIVPRLFSTCLWQSSVYQLCKASETKSWFRTPLPPSGRPGTATGQEVLTLSQNMLTPKKYRKLRTAESPWRPSQAAVSSVWHWLATFSYCCCCCCCCCWWWWWHWDVQWWRSSVRVNEALCAATKTVQMTETVCAEQRF